MPIKFETFPLRELRRGREFAWDPHSIDLSQDKADWAALKKEEQYFLLRQVLAFLIGERAVTHDLAPLQQALRRERGRMEEEMYLTQQQFEEATHVEFFQRWMNETLEGEVGKDIPFPKLYGNMFSEVLPAAMNKLNDDPSPANQLKAVVTYHMVIEGMLAELGYQIFYACIRDGQILPGLCAGVKNIQRDEARHIAFGTYLAQRILAEHPELQPVFDETLAALSEHGEVAARQSFEDYAPGTVPFGLVPERFIRMNGELARTRSLTVKRGALVAG